MQRSSLRSLLLLTIVVFTGSRTAARPDTDAAMQIPPVAAIPGITVEDRFPRACVDCHIDMPQLNQDERISTIMSGWYTATDGELLEKVRSVAGENFELEGHHPQIPESFRNIPGTCIDCHSEGAGSGLPFAPMMHVIHLSGGEDNHFLSIFQGECTHCHKLDLKKGTWSIPSAPEPHAENQSGDDSPTD